MSVVVQVSGWNAECSVVTGEASRVGHCVYRFPSYVCFRFLYPSIVSQRALLRNAEVGERRACAYPWEVLNLIEGFAQGSSPTLSLKFEGVFARLSHLLKRR